MQCLENRRNGSVLREWSVLTLSSGVPSAFLAKKKYYFQHKVDQREMNEAKEESQDNKLEQYQRDVEDQRAKTQNARDSNESADATIAKVLRGIDDLVR